MKIETSLFIAIEGIGGAGKTTLVEGLVKSLKHNGIKVVSFREFEDDSPIGQAYQQLRKNENLFSPFATVFLSIAERYWRSELIRQWLNNNYLILADRYYLSGLVYSKLQGFPFEEISSYHRKIIKPHFYIWLNVPFSVLIRRRKIKTEEKKLTKTIWLFQQACDYIKKKEGIPVFIIDASVSKEEVFKKALSIILNHGVQRKNETAME